MYTTNTTNLFPLDNYDANSIKSLKEEEIVKAEEKFMSDVEKFGYFD